jgi:hypothetical protein
MVAPCEPLAAFPVWSGYGRISVHTSGVPQRACEVLVAWAREA